MKIVNLTSIDLVIIPSDLEPTIYIMEGPRSLGGKKCEVLNSGESMEYPSYTDAKKEVK